MLSKYKNKIIKYSLFIGFAILFLYLIKNTNFSEMFIQLKKIDLFTIVLLLLLQAITQLILGVQWYRLVYCFSNVKSFYKVMYILCSGTVIEALTPGAKIGGEFTRYHYLKKELSISKADATKIIVVQKCISMSVLFTISILSFIYIFFTLSIAMSLFMKIASIGLALFLLFFLISLLFFSKYLLKCISFFNLTHSKVAIMIQSYHDSIQLIDTKEWIIQYCISLFVWIIFPMKMVILVSSLQVELSFIVLFAITMTCYSIGTLPITPGGLGTFEASLITLLQLVSIP